MADLPSAQKNWARGEWHEAARILHRANPDWTMRQIGDALGVTHSAVYKVLHPDRAKKYNRRGNTLPGRQEAKNRFSREYARRPENRGRCANPACGNLRGIGAAKHSAEGHCADCWRVIAEVRRSLTEGMWADGWKCREIEQLLGWEMSGAGQGVTAMRAHGWDLPHRYPPTRVERMRVARWEKAA